MSKVILAYSGGLDTSIAIKYLQEKYKLDVIALCVDVGENKNLEEIKEKALSVGALKCYAPDMKMAFAEDYLFPALKANAMYEEVYPLISALSRPLIAKTLVAIAKKENATYIAHGCTGKGNDQVRLDVSVNVIDPTLKIIAPVREHAMSREEAIEYAQKHQIPLSIKQENPFSIDQNLWGRSCECGVLEDPWTTPPEEAYGLTQSPENAPDKPAEVVISFDKGKPIALNGKVLNLLDLIETLNTMAGSHGVGRIDHIENRLVGIKSREVYEAPAATVLTTAHKALEAMTLPKEILHFKPMIEKKWSELVYSGLWFSPLMSALSAFIDNTQKTVSGDVKLKLYKGQAKVLARQSAHSLYQTQLATYTPQDEFNHQASIGFIELWGLSSKVFSKVNGGTQ